MSSEFVFEVEDKPGQLARITSALGKAGININGGSGQGSNGNYWICLVTDDEANTSKVLDSAGINYSTRDVVQVKLPNTPGSLGNFASEIASQGVNLNSFFITMEGNLVFSGDDIGIIRKIASDGGTFVS